MTLTLGEIVRSDPRHALTLTHSTNLTEAGALPSRRVPPGDHRYYDPVGLPLTSAGLHHWLIPTVFADKAGQTGLSCSKRNHAYVPLPVPRKDQMVGMSGTPVHPISPSP